MLQLGGIVVLFACVFGGYLMTGGSLEVVIEAAPHEMLTIFGAAIAAMLIAGSVFNLKKIGGSMGQIISGPRWKPGDYRDLLCLLFELIRLAKANPVAVEEHIEAPATSSIFGRYPRIAHDHEAVELICDTMRAASMNYDDPHQVEEVLKSSSTPICIMPCIPATRCSRSPTGCRRSGSSRQSLASSRPWARSTSRRKYSAA